MSPGNWFKKGPTIPAERMARAAEGTPRFELDQMEMYRQAAEWSGNLELKDALVKYDEAPVGIERTAAQEMIARAYARLERK